VGIHWPSPAYAKYVKHERQNVNAGSIADRDIKGETVIDLGSGAGFDVFLASPKVGPTGRVIGVDMNKV